MDLHNDYIAMINILEKEKDIYQTLLNLLKDKQTCVIQGKVDDLRDLIMKEKKTINESVTIAQKRVDFINDFCERRNIKGVNIPLKDFVGFSPEPEKKKMDTLRYDLKNILNEIKTVNRQNKSLLHFSIDHVRQMTNIFLHSGKEENNMYSIKGKKYIKEVNQKFVNQQI